MQPDAPSGGWLTQRLRSEFIAFLFVGGFSAAVNVIARYILNFWMSYDAAIVIAYLFGMITAFTLSRALVFSHAKAGDGRAQFLRFALVNVAAVLQVYAISKGLAEYAFPKLGFTWYAHDIAHCIGVVIPALTSYFGHKWFSFRHDISTI